MAKAIINAIFKVIVYIANIFTQPIADLLTEWNPDISSVFDNILIMFSYVNNIIGWFWHLIPPLTRGLILIIFNFYLVLYPIRIAITNATRSLDIIKRLNIFSSK